MKIITAIILSLFSTIWVSASADTAAVATAANTPEKQFEFLIGEWQCTYQQFQDAKTVASNPCQWSARYTFDGNMVQDDFRMFAKGSQDIVFSGTTLRTYVAGKKRWDFAFLSAKAGHWPNFHGTWHNEQMHIVAKGKDAIGEFDAKIRFYDITKQGFVWEMKKSYDQGNNWQLDSMIIAKKAANQS